MLDKGTLSYYKSQDEMSLGCKGSLSVAAAEITGTYCFIANGLLEVGETN